MNVVFYSTSDDSLKVNKSLTLIGSYNCQLKEVCSVNNPGFEISMNTNLLNANYAYVADFHRYYFIKITILDGTRLLIEGSVDRLMSFIQPNRAGLAGYVERNENDYNVRLVDNQAVFTNDRDIITRTIINPRKGTETKLDNWRLVGLFNAGLCNTAQAQSS